jgi:putative ABC transport system permease protein
MGSLLQDVRYGLRTLARNPAFSAVAVLTLALGIGANTAIFSLTDQILLRRLPVRNPEQLVALRTTGSNQGHVWSDSIDDSGMFSYPVYKDLRDRNQTFSNLLARFPTSVSVSGQGSTELAQAELVSGNYFEMLGVQPALGRVFSASDETAPGANTVAVLSYGYWTRHFGSDPGILNKQVVVNGTFRSR